jgi:hypothetical protein
MYRKVGLSITLIILLAMAFIISPAVAKGKQPRRIIWSQDSVAAPIAPGVTFSTTVTFTATRDLSNVTFCWTPSVGNILTVQPSVINSITSGTSTMLALQIIIPADMKRRNYNGNLWVLSNGKKLNKPLHLRFKIKPAK